MIRLLIAYLLAFLTLVIFMGVLLDYDFFRGPDVRSYWEDSCSWRTPFNPFHVPGYALTIALIHNLVPQLAPVTVMMGISLAAFLCTGIIVYSIGGTLGVSDRVRYLGALLFALWPFVGLTEAVSARADLFVQAIFLGGIYFLLRKRLNLSALLLGARKPAAIEKGGISRRTDQSIPRTVGPAPPFLDSSPAIGATKVMDSSVMTSEPSAFVATPVFLITPSTSVNCSSLSLKTSINCILREKLFVINKFVTLLLKQRAMTAETIHRAVTPVSSNCPA